MSETLSKTVKLASEHPFFLRLNDYLLSVLFEDTDILAIDKPYGINSHTNDSKVGNADFIQDGLIEIYEKQIGKPLYVVHRLDQTTTGVIIFAKSPAAAKKYAEFFFNRQVKKTYWFITAEKSKADSFVIDDMIVHKGKDLEAKTNFTRLKKGTGFELWQANPLTGRNHQIRIHAKAAGIPILGDEKYGGAAYPFLSLHNHRIEFPNGLVLKSSPPKYFGDLGLLEDQTLAKALFETDRRARLFSMAADSSRDIQNQCFRLVHNKNESRDLGFTVDHFGKTLALSWYQENLTDADRKSFSRYATAMGKPVIVRLMHNRGKDPLNKSQMVIFPDNFSETDIAAMETVWVASEEKIKYELRSDSGLSFGIFLDQRLQRGWVRAHAKDKTVLNLFSYTGGFSVAAALGQASQVTSVDTSKAVLNWSRKNFQINDLDPDQHKFLCRDSLEFLAQTAKKRIRYDLIICDPPSFSRGERGVFKIQDSLERLLVNCLCCLNENGELLFSTNFEGLFVDDIRKTIVCVQKSLGLKNLGVSSIQSGLDFELVGRGPILKSFLISKRPLPTHEINVELPTLTGDIDED